MRSYQHALKELQRENFELKLAIYDMKSNGDNPMVENITTVDAILSDEGSVKELHHHHKNGNNLMHNSTINNIDSSSISESNKHEMYSSPGKYQNIGHPCEYVLKVKFDEESNSKLISLEALISFLREQICEYRISNLLPKKHNTRPLEYATIQKSNITRLAHKCHQIAFELMEINIQRQYVAEKKGKIYPIEI